tara:strand:+ start:1970 stop:2197 length:228 start_codon:yes stop_codon:yes gene_type:complete
MTAGDRKAVGLLWRNFKQAREAGHPTKIRPIVINPTAPSTTVVMPTPTVDTDQVKIDLALFIVKHFECLRSLVRS